MDATPWSLQRHREVITDRILVAAAWIGLVAYVSGVALAWRNGHLAVIWVDTVAYAIVILLAVFRARVPFPVRAWAIPALAFALGVYLHLGYGPVVGAWVWMASGPIMAAVLLGSRAALGMLGVTLLTLVGIGAALVGRHLTWSDSGPDALELWVIASVNFTFLTTMMTLSVASVLTSLREEAEARQAAEGERARLALAVEQSPNLVVITDQQGAVTYANSSLGTLTGWSSREAMGRSPAALGLLSGEDAERAEADLADGMSWRGTVTVRRRDGTTLSAEAMLAPLRDETGHETHRVLTLRDTTREAELGRQLQQTQRLEAIGTLAGGIAHDFNNLLLPILTHADQAVQELPVGHPARAPFEDVAYSARRARELVRRILAFSRAAESDRHPIDVVPVVREAAQLLRSTVPASFDLVLDLPPDPVVIEANETDLHQVLMNLATNGWHAMRPHGTGTLTIRVAESLGTEDPRLIQRGLPGTWACLEVGDTGVGMPAAVQARVFDPFFTTKPVGEGTGLGLATVHGLVVQLGGVIVIESAPGEGTTMAIYLPRSGQVLDTDGVEAEADNGAALRILAVDDEPLVLRALERLATRLGHSVEAVGDPYTALARIGEDPEGFDLLFTDLTMPGMSGFDLARAAQARRPGLPVVLATGYLDAEDEVRVAQTGIQHVIVKPFALTELDEVLRRVAAGQRGEQDAHPA